MGTASKNIRFRWSCKELTHGSGQKDDTFAEDRREQHRAPQGQHDTQEVKPPRSTEAMVATCDEGEQRARSQARCVQAQGPQEIAGSLKRSAEHSSRRKTGAYRSALSMLTFYINRAGKTLPKTQRTRLERAKVELKRAFGKE